MNQIFYRSIAACSVLLGVGLWFGFSVHFSDDEKLTYEVNPACAKGSPYGKILALAMQGPIDLYWHDGETHESAEILNKEHIHKDGTSHSHSDDADNSDHGVHLELPEEVEKVNSNIDGPEVDESLVKQIKGEIKLMGATAKRRTDGTKLSPAHSRYIQSIIEDKVQLAYELDPTNYTNYGNLHLLYSVNLGKTTYDDPKAQKLAMDTLEICKKEKVDPSAWLTATSAAYHIVHHIGRYHNEYTEKEAKASLKEFDECVETFESLLALAIQSDRVVSMARLEEFYERVKFLRKLRHAQGVYMKRMMSKRAFGNLDSQSTDK